MDTFVHLLFISLVTFCNVISFVGSLFELSIPAAHTHSCSQALSFVSSSSCHYVFPSSSRIRNYSISRYNCKRNKWWNGNQKWFERYIIRSFVRSDGRSTCAYETMPYDARAHGFIRFDCVPFAFITSFVYSLFHIQINKTLLSDKLNTNMPIAYRTNGRSFAGCSVGLSCTVQQLRQQQQQQQQIQFHTSNQWNNEYF